MREKALSKALTSFLPSILSKIYLKSSNYYTIYLKLPKLL